jgi:hypothetical protein
VAIMLPLKDMRVTSRTLQNMEDKHVDQPAKIICDTLLRLRVAYVESLWLETTHFLKNVYVCRITGLVTSYVETAS